MPETEAPARPVSRSGEEEERELSAEEIALKDHGYRVAESVHGSGEESG